MPEKKKKTAVPRLRFPEFRHAGPWEVKRLGEIAEVVRGGSPRPISRFLTTDDDGFNWLKIGDIPNESKYVLSTEEKIKKSGLSKTREVHPGDLILSNSMSFGRPYIMGIRACIHDGWLALTNLKSGLLSEYLYYFILSDFSQRYLHDSAAGGGVRNLNADIVKLLPIATPLRVEEQQKIADCLASLDELIRAEEDRLAALKQHKKGLMQQLFPAPGETTPRLRFPEFRDAGPWEVKRLGEVCEILDRMRKPVTSTKRKAGPYPYYGASGAIDYIDQYIFDERLLLIGEDGAKWGPFEKTAYIVEGKYWVNNHAHVLRPIQINDVLLENYLNASDLSVYVTGAAPPKLTLDNLKAIRMPVPPALPEQQKIADCLASLDELIRAQGEKIEVLKQHKKGLMQQLFPQEVV